MSEPVFAQLCALASSLVLVMGIAILWRHSLQAYIDSFARQSLFFVLAILAVAVHARAAELYLVAAMVFALKVIFIPRVLHRARRYVGADVEIHPFINTPMSVLLAGILTLVAYAVAEPIVVFTELSTRGSILLALAVVFVGLFIIVSRRSALTQI